MGIISEFEEDVIKHIVIRLLLAVETMTEAHRAIIPENIMFDNDGNTFLAYFVKYISCENPQ